MNSIESFDAIVVGAGIPGLYAARQLKASGRTVLLLESSQTPEEPDYSTAGIPSETLHDFDLPMESINATIRHQVVGSQRRHVRKTAAGGAAFAYVLDFGKAKRVMGNTCHAVGVDVRYGTRVKRYETPVNNGPHRIHVENESFCAADVIDASGSAGVLAAAAGLRPKSLDRRSIGMEYRIRTQRNVLTRFSETIAIFYDAELLPHGYGWVFADGPDAYKVGLIEYWVDPKRQQPSVEQKLRRYAQWLGIDFDDPAFEVLGKHGGSKIISRHFGDVRAGSLYAIGDTIGAINPLLAEGIRQGLFSARFAVEAIVNQVPSSYERRWQQFKGPRWALSELFAHLCFGRVDPAFLESIVDISARMSSEELRRLVFHYEFERTMKCAPFTTMHALLPRKREILQFFNGSRDGYLTGVAGIDKCLKKGAILGRVKANDAERTS